MKIIYEFILILIFVSVSTNAQNYVSLTFDDAPDSSYTEQILDILEEENVKATFFVLGYKAAKYPEIINRINDEGHLIGNHSLAHRNFTEYNDSLSVLNDVNYVDSVLFSIIAKKPHYFRPPYGALRDDQKELLEEHGYEIAMWTLSTKDWDVFNITKNDIIDSVKQNIHSNAIILMHSKDASGSLTDYPLRNNTIDALPEVIRFLKEKNYQIVTLDKIVPSSNYGGDKNSLSIGVKDREEVIFYGGFEEDFNNDIWISNWGIEWESRLSECEIVVNSEDGRKSLRVGYPTGGVGPSETGAQFPIVFRNMSGLEENFYNEVYLKYRVKFEEEFDFRNGGKLPGLMGGGDSWTRSGGNQPDGTNGWTLRFMWVKKGKLIVYAYVPPSENGEWGSKKWGQNIPCNFTFETGKWHTIEQYVNVGTPNKDDGILKVWIDGVEKVNISNMRFWDIENSNGKIGGIYFSTFHGGNTKDWAPKTNSFAQFDELVVAKKKMDFVKPKIKKSGY